MFHISIYSLNKLTTLIKTYDVIKGMNIWYFFHEYLALISVLYRNV